MSLEKTQTQGHPRDLLVRLRDGLTKFLGGPPPLYPFAYLRICVALTLLVKSLCEWTSVPDLYGESGLASWSITESVLEEWAPRISWLVTILRAFALSAEACVWIVFVTHVLSLCGLLLGWHSRAMAIGAWLSQLMLMNSSRLSVYGIDGFANMALFYLAIAPSGSALSLDRRIGRTSASPGPGTQILLRLLQLHLCIVYFSSGILKATGTQWWNGEAIWRALMAPEFRVADLSWLSHVPWLLTLVGWGTLVLEIGYPAMIWWRASRLPWICGIIALHLSIAILMGLWLFSLMMMGLNVAAFAADDLHSVFRKVARRFSPDETTARRGRSSPAERSVVLSSQ